MCLSKSRQRFRNSRSDIAYSDVLIENARNMEKRRIGLVHNTIILLVGKISTQFINLVLLPLYTTILKPEEYGIADLFNTYVVLAIPIVSLNLDMGLFRFMLDKRDKLEEQKQILSSCVAVCFVTCNTYFAIYLLLQPWIHSEYKVFLLLHVVLNVFSSLFLQFARGLGHNGAYAFGSFFSALITTIMNIVFILIMHLGARGLFLSVVCGQIAVILYLFLSQEIWKYFSFKSIDISSIKPILDYSIPLIPTNAAWWVVNTSDRTVITLFINIAANGIYSIANRFSILVSYFYNVFNMAWTETVVLHINDDDRDSFLSDMVNSLYSLFFSACILIVALMPFAFPLLINSQYNDAYNLIPILMAGVFCLVICGICSAVFLAKKKTKENAKTAVFAALINLITDLILIKLIGLYAAAISTFIAYFAMAVYRYLEIQKYVKVHICKKRIIVSVALTVIVFGAYYSNYIFVQGIVAIISTIYVIVVNKDFGTALVKMIVEMFHNHSRFKT